MATNPFSSVLSFPDATTLVREHAASLRFAYPRKTEILSLAHALGRVIGRPVIADRDQPPFDRATRDGYACYAADLQCGHPLPVSGQIRAGDIIEMPRARLAQGQAIEIMTGAPVPAGADCVIMFEHVQYDPDANTIQLSAERCAHPLPPGANIVPAGAEARKGDIVLYAGTRLAAPHIAAAAACGASSVHIYSSPGSRSSRPATNSLTLKTHHLPTRFATRTVIRSLHRSPQPGASPTACPSSGMTPAASNRPSAWPWTPTC